MICNLCCLSLTDWTNIGTAVGTIGLAIIAIVQLPQLTKSSRLSVLVAVFEQENELNARKIAVDEIAFKIREFWNSISINPDNRDPNQLDLDLLTDRLGIAIENYLNLMDRIAFSIRENYFPERDWKKEYEKYFEKHLLLILKSFQKTQAIIILLKYAADGTLPETKNYIEPYISAVCLSTK